MTEVAILLRPINKAINFLALLRFVWAALKTPWFIGQLMPQRGF
jgi:hypothetical protein